MAENPIASGSDSALPPRRRHNVLSLWGLLLGILVVVVAGGCLAIVRWKYADQIHAAQEIERLGGVCPVYEKTPGFLSFLIGRAAYCSVPEVYLDGTRFSAQAPRLFSLEQAGFEESAIQDRHLAEIGQLTGLKMISLGECDISDDGLEYMKRLRHLKILGLFGTKVTDHGLRHLVCLTQLEELGLSDTNVTDDGMATLEKLPCLTTLGLDGTKVSDRSVEILVRFTMLRTLMINRTKISQAGYRKLKKALPSTQISWGN